MSTIEKPVLLGSPLSQLPCRPTLFLGLPEWVPDELATVLMHDLAFAETSTFRPEISDRTMVLKILSHLQGKDLVQLTKVHGGSVIVEKDELWRQKDDGEWGADIDQMNKLRSTQQYHAVIVDDGDIVRSPEIAIFCGEQYNNKEVSIVIMGLTGMKDISVIRETFNVTWEFARYERETMSLTERGKQVLGNWAFPVDEVYTKSIFIKSDSPEEEYLLTEDIDSSEDEDEDNLGSAIVLAVQGQKAVSYFGFVTSPLELYGAIIHRLCCAAALPGN